MDMESRETEVLRPPVGGSPQASLQDEVRERFGLLPNFFRLAPDTPEITANLWGFAKFAYLDNPLPSLFKERLFVYLSRFCDVRYCIARHVGFLIGLGRPSGDPHVTPQSIDDVLRLLRYPLADGEKIDALIGVCANCEAPLTELPEADSAMETAVIACASHVFLQTSRAPAAADALKTGPGRDGMAALDGLFSLHSNRPLLDQSPHGAAVRGRSHPTDEGA